MKLPPEQEKERLAQWLRCGTIYTPHSEENVDSLDEDNLPKKKAPDGADG